MGAVITGDVVDSTDVMVPEQGNAPAPQVTEQESEAETPTEAADSDQKDGEDEN